MCTADVAQSVFWNPQEPSAKTTPTSDSVRFAMKFPRCNAFTNANSRSRDAAGISQQQLETSTMSTPRASSRVAIEEGSHGAALPNGYAVGSNMRRCQSANASRRPRGIMAGMREHSMHKSRSHSTENTPRHCQGRHQRSQELPIPTSKYGHNRPSLSHSVDKSDLTRMYDYATWNMYERIVNARKQRLTQMDQHQKNSSSSTSGASRKAATVAAAAGSNAAELKKSQPLYKTSSHDDSLAATVDETDKSSTTSSSWSRTDSPMAFPPGSGGLAFANYERAVSSCPPPGADMDEMNANEDHFIFQMDM